MQMIDQSVTTLWPQPPAQVGTSPYNTFRAILGRLGSLSFWREALFVGVMLVVYVLLLQVPLPFTSPAAAKAAIEGSWWPWKVVNLVITGGALSRASVLSVGAFGLFLTRNYLFPHLVGRVKLGRMDIVSGLLATAIPAVLVEFGMVLVEIMQPEVLPICVNGILLVAGAVFVELVNVKLQRSLGFSIITLNAVIVLGSYVLSLRSLGDTIGASVMIAVSLIFLLIYLASQKRVRKVHVIDRATGFNQEADVVISYSDNYVQYAFVGLWCMIASLLLLLIGFLFQVPLDLQSPTYLNLLLLCGLAVAFSIFVGRYGFFSSFSPEAVARFLQRNIWIVPGVHPGDETEDMLRNEVAAIAQYWILFFTGWYVVFWILEYVAIGTGRRAFLFPGGAVLCLIVLTLAAYLFYVLIMQVHSLAASGYRVGELKEIRFMSTGLDMETKLILHLARFLPEPTRTEFIEAWLDSRSKTVPKTLVRLALDSLRPYGVDAALERAELEEAGLLKSLLLEIGHAAVRGLAFSAFILAILRLAGFTFGANRLDILLIITPFLWDILSSGRTWLILKMISERIWTRLYTFTRRIGEFIRNHH
jgi:preprotein translocase subunit SecY